MKRTTLRPAVGYLVCRSGLACLMGLACVPSCVGVGVGVGVGDGRPAATTADHPPQATSQPRQVLGATPPASRIVAWSGTAQVGVVDRFEIGRSAGDRPIYVYRLSAGEGDPDTKPGLLIVAGLDARQSSMFAIARGLIEKLDGVRGLADATVYVIAQPNPDASALDSSTNRLGAAFPGGTLTPVDLDRDGRVDEDGPMDLNGDGFITMMRIANPPPEYGLRLTHIVDPDQPRLMRPADASKGEVATHAMHVEAIDQDGDGKMGEDGVGGVDLNMNFPYRWPEFANGNGAYPLSEAESKALATWLLGRPNILATVVYGPHDTIVNVPEAGRFDHTGRVPLGLERDDKALMDRLSEMYKEATKVTRAERVGLEGSFAGWAYAHLGLLTIATNPWQRPDAPKDEAQDAPAEQPKEEAPAPAADEPPFVMIGDFKLVLTREAIMAAMSEAQGLSPDEQQARMDAFMALPEPTRQRIMNIAQGAADPAAPPQPPPARTPARPARRGTGGASEDAAWLAYADRVGHGYVDWQPYDHPQLGRVEIGGFVPGLKINPPEDMIDEIVRAQAGFVEQLLAMLPRVVVDAPVVERVDEGVWRVSVTVRNEGELPTRTAMGTKARWLTPYVLALVLPRDRVLAGSPIERRDSIAAGQSLRAQWLVLGGAGEKISAQLRTVEFGTTEITIELAETTPAGAAR